MMVSVKISSKLKKVTQNFMSKLIIDEIEPKISLILDVGHHFYLFSCEIIKKLKKKVLLVLRKHNTKAFNNKSYTYNKIKLQILMFMIKN